MPRTIKPPLPRGTLACCPLNPEDFQNVRAIIRDLALGCKSIKELPEGEFENLLAAIALEYLGRIKTKHWLRGKNHKPEAIDLDEFTFAIMRVWCQAGLKFTIWDDHAGKSEFLDFVESIARALKLMGARDSLLHNALRARTLMRQLPGPPRME